MILTKEHQDYLTTKYLQGHTIAEVEAFVDGMDAIVELINKHEKTKQDDKLHTKSQCKNKKYLE